VPRVLREAIADWLMLLGAVALFVSLFLVWSHQFPTAFRAQWGDAVALRGTSHAPTAWQVYAAADVCLAAVAATILYVSFVGTRRARIVALVPVLVALAFVVHARTTPPTNGVNVTTPSLPSPSDTGLLAPSAPAAKSKPATPTRVPVPVSATPVAPVAADHPTAGPGETVALIALAVAAAGLILSFTAD
jgi:hypothetical protein